MADPGRRHITVRRGDTYTHTITMATNATGTAPLDITGRTYAAQARRLASDTTPAFTFTCTVTDPTNGELTVTLPAATTATLDPDGYVWDLQETAPGGLISTVLAGDCIVTEDITR